MTSARLFAFIFYRCIRSSFGVSHHAGQKSFCFGPFVRDISIQLSSGKIRYCDDSWLYLLTCLVISSFLVVGTLIIRITVMSTMLRIGWIPCLVIQYHRYSTCPAKNLDFELFTLIPEVESVARTISNILI
jgi:hypothetical protein